MVTYAQLTIHRGQWMKQVHQIKKKAGRQEVGYVATIAIKLFRRLLLRYYNNNMVSS